MPTALLSDRGVIEVAGRDSADFLNRLLTNLVPTEPAPHAVYAALLTPQGKVLADMLIVRHPAKTDAFLLDCAKSCIADLLKRFTLYRLRAELALTDLSDQWTVAAIWSDDTVHDNTLAIFTDPRHPSLGNRAFIPHTSDFGSQTATYHAHRIAWGIAEGDQDFSYGDVFPHEINLDQFHGLDFHKGCYVGQEVVSRMEHRGTARSRVIALKFPDGSPADTGEEIKAGSLLIGHVGSVTPEGMALGLIRLDRAEEALKNNQPMLAGGQVCIPLIPEWARLK
jgi:tRNA-modifying protein YgfZ